MTRRAHNRTIRANARRRTQISFLKHCACPSIDAVFCIIYRYKATRDKAEQEPCECICHSDNKDDDDEL